MFLWGIYVICTRITSARDEINCIGFNVKKKTQKVI